MTDQKLDWLVSQPIAHRGLHDDNRRICENSLSAFKAAIEHGYAIECDVRLSGDGVPVVFHDDTLPRMTGQQGLVASRSAAELGALRLGETADRIPTLDSVLRLVRGQVPLVIELKGSSLSEDTLFVERVRPVVEHYDGPLALMSFDPWLIEQATALSERIPIGLTAEGTRADCLDRHREIFEGKCSFVSYNVHHLPNSFVSWVREEQQLPVISWTLRTPDDVARSMRHADQMTFEGFLPQL